MHGAAHATTVVKVSMGMTTRCGGYPLKCLKRQNFIVGYHLQDFQRIHSGYNVQEIKGVSIDVDPKMWTVGYLQKTY